MTVMGEQIGMLSQRGITGEQLMQRIDHSSGSLSYFYDQYLGTKRESQ
jgi:hypothetical protein